MDSSRFITRFDSRLKVRASENLRDLLSDDAKFGVALANVVGRQTEPAHASWCQVLGTIVKQPLPGVISDMP